MILEQIFYCINSVNSSMGTFRGILRLRQTSETTSYSRGRKNQRDRVQYIEKENFRLCRLAGFTTLAGDEGGKKRRKLDFRRYH
jgi:hypothetical protein